ncbi:Uncharacterised protein [Mycobacterium tuberculosis]|nr:Uncharacterised protein [Mycobacterium tuberculosis]
MPPIPSQPHGQQAELAMPQPEYVAGKLTHRRPVVDADPGHSGEVFGLVDHHHRQPPLQHDLQVGIVVAYRIHHEAVHPSAEHGSCAVRKAPTGADGNQLQALPQLFARLRHSRNKIPRGRVAEEIGQRFGHHQTDRTGFAGPQRSRHRIRSGIAQSLGRGKHSFT